MTFLPGLSLWTNSAARESLQAGIKSVIQVAYRQERTEQERRQCEAVISEFTGSIFAKDIPLQGPL